MSKIHLICGAVGAGKTTYATKLCRIEPAMNFSIDQWMTGLFSPDLKGEIDYGWAMARIERMESLIWSQVVQLMELNVAAVLDLGLLQRKHRQKFYQLAHDKGYDICLHFVDVEQELRWQRVLKRNAEKGASYSMEVNRDMFDFCETLFESPSGDELDFIIIHKP